MGDVGQIAFNHNGGSLLFLDGLLYIFTGDGGKQGDPFNNSQNMNSLLGKVLRIDVDQMDAGLAYSIPKDNPFYGADDTRAEIFAYGLRNPWRCTIDQGDQLSGAGKDRIICGDVGQNDFEEVDIIMKGANYGWNRYEGFSCYKDCDKIDSSTHTKPIYVYDHSVGISVTGGYVYRGDKMPNLNGKYLFGDWLLTDALGWGISGGLFALEENFNGTWTNQRVCFADSKICAENGFASKPGNFLNSFARDEHGELYLLTTDDYQAETRPVGAVYKVVDPSFTKTKQQTDAFHDAINESLQSFIRKETFEDIHGAQQKSSSTLGYSLTNIQVAVFNFENVKVESNSQNEEVLMKISGSRGVLTADYSVIRKKRWSKIPTTFEGTLQGVFAPSDVQLKASIKDQKSTCTALVSNLQLVTNREDEDVTVQALLPYFQTSLEKALEYKICSSLVATFEYEKDIIKNKINGM